MDTCKMCGSNNFFGGVYSPLQMPDDKWCKNVDKCKSYLIDKLIKENNELKEALVISNKSQISCDCMVGGECEAPGNCANGMIIEKLKKDYEYQKSKHIETSEKLEIMNFIEQFSDCHLVGKDREWFENETFEQFCDEALEQFPDNKDMFYKTVRCKYDMYDDKLKTYEEVEKFCVECYEEGYIGSEDFDIELLSEEEVLELVGGQCSNVYKCEIEGVKYYLLVE